MEVPRFLDKQHEYFYDKSWGGGGEDAAYSPRLGELSSGCHTMPVDLTSVGHGKFEFEIIKLRAIPDKEMLYASLWKDDNLQLLKKQPGKIPLPDFFAILSLTFHRVR